jgi:hypothetical protein
MTDTLTLADLTDQERRWLVNIFAALAGHIEDGLILDSRVVMGQFWRNKLFVQAFHGGRDRGDIFG